MITMNDIKKWTPLSKMENADEKIYKERVQGAYEVELPHSKLKLIPYVGSSEIVQYYTEELIGLCPVTFLPDFYTIRIFISPDALVPELKSLKYYFGDYMQLPISHEHLANKIYNEVRKQLKPNGMYLELKTAVRGGLYTNVYVGDPSVKRKLTPKKSRV